MGAAAVGKCCPGNMAICRSGSTAAAAAAALLMAPQTPLHYEVERGTFKNNCQKAHKVGVLVAGCI